MSESEPEERLRAYGERRMAIMNEVHDIMSESEPEERRMALRNEVLELLIERNGVVKR